jgi:CRP-like cAMP-binding protein
MSETAYQNVHKRAFILLTLNAKERYMQILKEEPYLLNKFQHYLIASYIGVAPESLSRLRKEITKSKK